MVKILDERKSNIGSALVLAVLAMSFSEVVQRRIGGVTYLRGEFLDGAWWQPFTAQLVHITFVHAVLNVAAMVLIATSFRLLLTVREQFLTFMGGVFGVALAVAMDPHCSYYAGASGALHGMLGGGAVLLFFSPAHKVRLIGGNRMWAVLILLILLLKLFKQHSSGGPLELGWLGFPTYYPAHEWGTWGGIVVAGLMLAAKAASKR